FWTGAPVGISAGKPLAESGLINYRLRPPLNFNRDLRGEFWPFVDFLLPFELVGDFDWLAFCDFDTVTYNLATGHGMFDLGSGSCGETAFFGHVDITGHDVESKIVRIKDSMKNLSGAEGFPSRIL